MDPASLPVLQKLGFTPPPRDLHSGEPSDRISFGSFSSPVSSDSFRIGSIPLPIVPDIPGRLPSFQGVGYIVGLWDSIPDEKLFSVLDCWQAGYDNDNVKLLVQISSVPTKEYIYKRLLHCSLCDCLGHVDDSCTGIFCQGCGDISGTCVCMSTRTDARKHEPCRVGPNPLGLQCNACSAVNHITRLCPGLRRCPLCHRLGHKSRKLPACASLPRWAWKKKNLPQSKRILPRVTAGASEVGISVDVGMARATGDPHGGCLSKRQQTIPCHAEVANPHCLTIRLPGQGVVNSACQKPQSSVTTLSSSSTPTPPPSRLFSPLAPSKQFPSPAPAKSLKQSPA